MLYLEKANISSIEIWKDVLNVVRLATTARCVTGANSDSKFLGMVVRLVRIVFDDAVSGCYDPAGTDNGADAVRNGPFTPVNDYLGNVGQLIFFHSSSTNNNSLHSFPDY